jgi:SAM-dependent methyltransferase
MAPSSRRHHVLLSGSPPVSCTGPLDQAEDHHVATPTSCPLCAAGADDQFVVTHRVYGDESGRAVFHCRRCDVRYLFPGQSPQEEAHFYAQEFESFMIGRSASGAGWEGPERHIAANESQRQRRMTHLRDILKPNSRVLEFGCSSGFMLYPLAQAGHRCAGVEPSGVFSEYVRNRGVSCFQSLDDLTAAEGGAAVYDLILHYYVLEHVSDPVGFLRRQFALLKPGGKIVFEVPNANDALTTVYDMAAYERFIWVVSHHWYFSEGSLAKAMEMAGGTGEVRFDQRYDLSNHMIWARDGKPGGMGRFTNVFGQELEDQYRQALIGARCCDTLIGILSTPH